VAIEKISISNAIRFRSKTRGEGCEFAIASSQFTTDFVEIVLMNDGVGMSLAE